MTDVTALKNEQNNSLGMLINDTWLNHKEGQESAESFQMRLDQIKRKAKTPTARGFTHITQLIKNPKALLTQSLNKSKFQENIKSNQNNDEDADLPDDSVPATTERINMMAISKFKNNSLIELNKQRSLLLRFNTAPLQASLFP